MPEISSCVIVLAIASRPIFLNLFIAENFFILVMTTLSRGPSGASPFSRTQGWFRISSMVARCDGFFTRMLLTTSFAPAALILCHGSPSRSYFPRSTLSKMPLSVDAQKGGRPQRRM